MPKICIRSWSDLVDLFESRIVKDRKTGCWIYSGAKDNRGYGRIESKRLKMVIKTHRLSWIIRHGEIGPDQFVCHKCDNPPCCNPDHLFIGNSSTNFKDMWRKGRQAKHQGSQHGLSKLTEKMVLQIRELNSSGCRNQNRLAKMFKVTQPTISLIVRRKIWRHI